ncbi:MAG: hypothetical protein RJB60_250, partial [Pseudomonadota bacterium]
MLSSLPDGYRALVIGAQGGLGAAFVQHLRTAPRCGAVWGAVRSPEAANEVRLDLQEPASIEQAAGSLRPHGPFHVLIDAT